MSHKAGKDFFVVKRDWSRRKDLVLGHYLKPYLPKIATQRRPVVVVDGFAGPGEFEDNSPGSPLIICNLIRDIRNRTATGEFRVLLIERDSELAERLRSAVRAYSDFAEVLERPFESVLPDIEALTATSNLFLYLDPFTVSGLAWESLDRVFQQISRAKSIEVLLNFNIVALARAACVATGRRFNVDADEGDELVGESASTKETVDTALGGSWWRRPFSDARSFPAACDSILHGYLANLRTRFAQVCHHEIKESHGHAVAKYILVFGSRHPDALELMNDAMAKSLEFQARKESPPDPVLFEPRPESLVPDTARLDRAIERECAAWRARGEVIHGVIRQEFGKFVRADIRGRIERMLKEYKLESETGAPRINDQIRIRLRAGGSTS